MTVVTSGDYGKPRPALIVQADLHTGHPSLTVRAGFVEVSEARSDWAPDPARPLAKFSPPRRVPHEAGAIVSPADGKVEDAEWIETSAGSRVRVSIFLNVFDVHVNRVPVSGRVSLVEYREGAFLNALNAESAVHNEQTLIMIDTGGYSVSFKQIAGVLARRIVCNLREGDSVIRGQRMGLIKFGSRTDVLLPAGVTLRVKAGDRVKGGSSVLAVMPAAPDATMEAGSR